MNKVLIIGSGSDIAQGIIPFFKQDQWAIDMWHREHRPKSTWWNLCLITIGSVAPVGKWWKVTGWMDGVDSNLIVPVTALRQAWENRAANATVIFFAGSNPNATMSGYSSYTAGKMGLLKAVEWMDDETPDAKILALGPGTVLTKIHKPTLKNKWDNPKLLAAMQAGKSTPMRKIYDAIHWCYKQPKEIVGGRNICVSDSDDWQAENELARMLQGNPARFKLRRVE